MILPFPHWDIPCDLDTPSVVVDLARMEHNLAITAEALAERGVALRPHAKTHKSIGVARRQLAAGAVGITTATLSEALAFAEGGIDDLFVAYPVWATSAKGAAIRRILRTGARLRVGVDSVEGVHALAAVVECADDRFEVVVEVDAGEARTGVRHPAEAVAVADAAAAAGLTVAGVFTHGGHSYAAPEAALPAADDEVRVLREAAQAMEAAGHSVPVRSAGSTPTALHSARDGVSEARPGTFVFGDRQQATLGATDPGSVALFVAATVVSSGPGQFVIDAGAKVLSKDKPPILDGYGALPAYPEATIDRVYDHHGIVLTKGRPAPRLGEVVSVIPNHVCPVVNLASELWVLAAGRIVDRFEVDAKACNR